MSILTRVLLIILAVLIVVVVVLYILGRRTQKRQDEQQQKIDENAQVVTMLVIDKRKMALRDAGLPEVVMENVPKRQRRSRVPIVKAKVGSNIMSFMCDPMIFDDIPIKKEIKATVSGIYISAVRGARGPLPPKPEKQGFFKRHFGRNKEASA